MIALAINCTRVALSVIVPVAVYAGQVACDVWAEKAKKRTGKRKRSVRKRKSR